MNSTAKHCWIDSPKAFDAMISQLQSCGQITIDTEYDSFKRSYGFKALLIQIFDGAIVFIVDPLSGLDLSPLWNVFEDQDIQKVLYSGSEDIALLKAMGCNIQNIFDVQIAATLSNHPARNLGGLIEAETGSPLDKSQQQSDWSKRPLSEAQLSYAANDVIYLPEIANTLTAQVASKGLLHVLRAENDALEEISPRTHQPKLKPYHFRMHSDAFCVSLLDLLNWRDGVAREWNIPPVHVVDVPVLEQALLLRDRFLKQADFKGFNPKIKRNQELQEQVLSIVSNFDINNMERLRERKPKRDFYTKEEVEQRTTTLCVPFKQIAVERYGEVTADFLLRGLKKLITTPDPDLSELKDYQIELYRCMLEGKQWPW
jgi:ribonuclease D